MPAHVSHGGSSDMGASIHAHGGFEELQLSSMLSDVSLGKRQMSYGKGSHSLSPPPIMTSERGSESSPKRGWTDDSGAEKKLGLVHFSPSAESEPDLKHRGLRRQNTPHSIRVLKENAHRAAAVASSSNSSLVSPSFSGASGSPSCMSAFASPRPSSASTGTMLFYVGSCLNHMPGVNSATHQECGARLDVLCGPEGVLRSDEFAGIEWRDGDECDPAPISALLRVHDYSYLRHIQAKCKEAAPPPQTSTLMAGKKDKAETKIPFEGRAPAGYLDADTCVSPDTWGVVKQVAGAAMEAVDCVDSGMCRNAFVVCRPPGHHAGPHGCVLSSSFWLTPNMTSSGFCIVNTVAVAASYARAALSRPGGPKRVAIVDIDIHHGNGTQEIVQCLRPHTTCLPLPGSWAEQTITTYKPWFDESDADNVFFASIHLCDGPTFYPGTGDGSGAEEDSPNIVNVALSAVHGGGQPGDMAARTRLTRTKRDKLCASASEQFRTKVREKLLPPLRAFEADMLFISAGFDGHVDDKYFYNTDEDYEWVTTELIDSVKSGKVVSVLEGGYSLQDPYHKHASPKTASATGGPRRRRNSPGDLPATVEALSAEPQAMDEQAPSEDKTCATAATATSSSTVAMETEDGKAPVAAAGAGEAVLLGGLAKGVSAHVRALLRASSASAAALRR